MAAWSKMLSTDYTDYGIKDKTYEMSSRWFFRRSSFNSLQPIWRNMIYLLNLTSHLHRRARWNKNTAPLVSDGVAQVFLAHTIMMMMMDGWIGAIYVGLEQKKMLFLGSFGIVWGQNGDFPRYSLRVSPYVAAGGPRLYPAGTPPPLQRFARRSVHAFSSFPRLAVSLRTRSVDRSRVESAMAFVFSLLIFVSVSEWGSSRTAMVFRGRRRIVCIGAVRMAMHI